MNDKDLNFDVGFRPFMLINGEDWKTFNAKENFLSVLDGKSWELALWRFNIQNPD